MSTNPERDITEARRLASEGIEKAMAKAGKPWMNYAIRFLYSLAQDKKILTADTLWEAEIVPPESKHAMGGLWRTARRLGIVRELKHDGYICCTISNSTKCHGMLTRVYESCVYAEPKYVNPDQTTFTWR